MRKKRDEKLPPAMLLKLGEEVTKILQIQIDKGNELLAMEINLQSELEQARLERDKWDARNKEYLLRLFDNPSKLEDYEGQPFPRPYFAVTGSEPNIQDDVRPFKEWVGVLVSRLERILSVVDIMEGAPRVRPMIERSTSSATPQVDGDLLDQRRRTLSSDQREMLNLIWDHYAEEGEWITPNRLHHHFRLRPSVNVESALTDLGGGIVFESGYGEDEGYI
jgi:hypothetical protein